MLAGYGLVQPLVWSRCRDNLVSGHQGLAYFDQRERRRDHGLQVPVVDVDEREEKALNVQLGNPSMQGDGGMDKLAGCPPKATSSPRSPASPQAASPACPSPAWMGPLPIRKKWPKPRIPCAKSRNRAERPEKLKRNAGGECYFTAACENKAQKKAMPKAPGVPQWETSVYGLSATPAVGG